MAQGQGFEALEAVAGGKTHAAISLRLVEEGQAIHREDIESNMRMGKFGAELLPSSGTILTHCNAGALATAGYGTAMPISNPLHTIGVGQPTASFLAAGKSWVTLYSR